MLMDTGYKVHLANPAGIQKDKGLKYSGDKHDAFWLAHLLRLGIIAEDNTFIPGVAHRARSASQTKSSCAVAHLPD
jgi:hypothetical protein